MLLSSLQIIGCSYQACFAVVLVRSCYHAFLLRERWGRSKVNSHCFEASCSFPSFYPTLLLLTLSQLFLFFKKKKKDNKQMFISSLILLSQTLLRLYSHSHFTCCTVQAASFQHRDEQIAITSQPLDLMPFIQCLQ